MIDWMNPSDDVLEARRIGYDEAAANMDDLQKKIERLTAELAATKKRNHDAGHDLIEEIGSTGPENIDSIAGRAVEIIRGLRAELAEIKRNAFGLDHPDDDAILYGTEKACEIACQINFEKDKRIEELEEGARVDFEDQERYLKLNADLRAELAQCNLDRRTANEQRDEAQRHLRIAIDGQVEHAKRIEELELNQNYYPKLPPGEHIITDEQIDLLWKRRSFYTGAALAAIDDCLDAINIVACPECGGSGRIPTPATYAIETGGWDEPCPACHGHGRVIKK